MILLVLALGILSFLIVLRWRYRKYIKLSKILKHDLVSLPFLGIASMFFGNDEDRLRAVHAVGREVNKQNGIMSVWLGHNFFVVSSDPIISEYILKRCLEKHDIMKKAVRTILGNTSIVAPVSIWRPRRKILLPTFSHKNLNQFVSVFDEQSKVMVEMLRPSTGQSVPLFEYVTKYTLESVCETTLGVHLNIQRQPDHPFLRAMSTGLKMTAQRALQPWFTFDVIYKLFPQYVTVMKISKYLFDFTGQIIAKQRERLAALHLSGKEDSPDRMKSLLDHMIEFSGGDNGYSDIELCEETLTLIIAGTDTSAVGTGFVALLLAKYPNVQQKILEEVTEVIGEEDRPIVAEDLTCLKYLDAVIKECLRLYPPVPFVPREVDRDVELPSGITVPKGTGFIAYIWAANRNPRYWGEDAEEFRPERFLDFSPKHPAQFLSFSNGPRNCVGYQYALMSMKTVLAKLLHHYRILPSPKTTEPFRLTYEVMMKHADNVNVILEARRKKIKASRGLQCEKV